MKRNCRILKREMIENIEKKKNDKDTIVVLSDEEVMVLLVEEGCIHVAQNETEWIVDTAASYHATPRKEFFTTYKAGDFGIVNMGNNNFSKCGCTLKQMCLETTDVHIETNVGCTLILKDVRHIPNLRLNLHSGLVLDRDGYEN